MLKERVIKERKLQSIYILDTKHAKNSKRDFENFLYIKGNLKDASLSLHLPCTHI